MSVKFIAETVLTAKDQSGAAFAAYAKNAQNATKHLQHLEKQQSQMAAMAQRAKQFAVVAGGALASVGVAKFSQNMIGISAKYEDLGAVLETLEGSSEKAKSSLAWIKNFTKETPYELQNTAEAFSRLKAYGIDPMNGTMRTLGDTSAAMGKDIMDAVEMMADAVVGENERLKEFGIRASIIKGKKGKSDQIEYSYKNKMGEQKTALVSKDDQEQIRKVLMDIFNEKYLGAMEKRSKTFNGILSNMKDTISGLKGQFMDGGLFDMAKSGLQGSLDWMTRLGDSGAVAQWGKNAANALRLLGDGLSYVSGLITHASSQLVAYAAKWDVVAEKLGVSTERINKIKAASQDAKQWLASLWGGEQQKAAPITSLFNRDNGQYSKILEFKRKVESGDTLWKWAKELHGVGSQYQKIADLNRGVIKDANKIKAGQVLNINAQSPYQALKNQRNRFNAPNDFSQLPTAQILQFQKASNNENAKALQAFNDLFKKAFDIDLLERYNSQLEWAKSYWTQLADKAKSAKNGIIAMFSKDITAGLSRNPFEKFKFFPTELQRNPFDIKLPREFQRNMYEVQRVPEWLMTINRLSVKAFDVNILERYRNEIAIVGEKYQQLKSNVLNLLGQIKTNSLATFSSLGSWIKTDGESAIKWLSSFALSALPFLISAPLKIMAVVSSKLPALINQAREKLPLLGTQIANITKVAKEWAVIKWNGLQPQIEATKLKAFEYFGQWMEKLNAMANDGRLNTWLDNAYSKLSEVAKNTWAFAAGVLAFGENVKNAVVWVKDKVGGWENLGKLAAGLFLFTKLTTVFAAVAAFAEMIVNIGGLAAGAARGVLLLGRALGIGKAFSALASGARMIAPILLAAGRAALFTGAAFLASPIGLVLGGIAIAATAVYYNWDKLVNLWNNSELKKVVMPLATKALDYAKEKWEQLKNWWNNSTLTEKALGIITAPVQIAWTITKDFFGWWSKTEFGQKALAIGADAINWAKQKANEFMSWWNNTSLSQKAIDILTKPLEWAWSLVQRFYNWWTGTSFGSKSIDVASGAIEIAKNAALNFVNWWQNLRLNPLNLNVDTSGLVKGVGSAVSSIKTMNAMYNIGKSALQSSVAQSAKNKIADFISGKQSTAPKPLITKDAFNEMMARRKATALNLGEGRAIGGTVTAGTMYPVLERQSEIFSAAGKHYFMARENGVISTLDQFRRNQGVQSQIQAQTVKPFIAPTLGQQTGRVDAAITVRVEASEGLRVTNTGTETRKQGSLIRNVGVSMAA